ncbi:DUF6090 family protein [Olleya aquimaris]|uniref:Uncharacterized protein n=1 Tax=Olleya aquimaris TaxID=639310 RepID=A0A327R882_9FLAO|nr:DUF6090 family protein [Olleya aquimaris]RAJ11763.1 hypothetical protein LY08_02693 [Olleya aquimaris]
MIKFFRRIRQKLLSENKFSKYLIYAIGEILLVVIGILIALQINNWNETRKTEIVEIEIYKEIKVDLKAVLGDWKSGIKTHSEYLENSIKLRDHIIKRKPLNGDVSSYLSNAHRDDQFFPRSVGLEALKSAGLETLTNDTLRRKIITIYERGFKRIELLGYHNAPRHNFSFLQPLTDKYLTLSDSYFNNYKITKRDSIKLYRKRIVNYEKLLNDEQLLMKLQDAIKLRAWKLAMYKRWYDHVANLSTLIDAELDRLQD